ncbi:hypothetical protein F7725_000737 [Dissostichus mawsoni]|uniref:Uncharacterized protein n=1 Tax=Dissostichus mawsoni TaxID=36200 RepID=A0A7J5ZF95_DISMA|nr:hypothetical protein F7725_000737 [Dissostichus mawsoni]
MLWRNVYESHSRVCCGFAPSHRFKEGRPINHLISEKHKVTPQNNPEQSLYTCQGIRSGRPSYSKFSESFTTKNLLLKRRVLLSISGLIFFGIIAVLLGCIVLRVFRKPDDGDENPEETELFLTMAQLKERDDAPCPMVQYITDAELNSPPKVTRLLLSAMILSKWVDGQLLLQALGLRCGSLLDEREQLTGPGKRGGRRWSWGRRGLGLRM